MFANSGQRWRDIDTIPTSPSNLTNLLSWVEVEQCQTKVRAQVCRTAHQLRSRLAPKCVSIRPDAVEVGRLSGELSGWVAHGSLCSMPTIGIAHGRPEVGFSGNSPVRGCPGLGFGRTSSDDRAGREADDRGPDTIRRIGSGPRAPACRPTSLAQIGHARGNKLEAGSASVDSALWGALCRCILLLPVLRAGSTQAHRPRGCELHLGKSATGSDR